MPRRPTTGSELSLTVFRNMSSSETTGNFPVAFYPVLHRKHWPSTRDKRLGIPFLPHTPILVRCAFRGLTTVRLRYDLLLCLPSCRSRPDSRPAIESVYIRASDGLVTRAVAGYHYSANWAICTGETFTR